MSPGTSTGRHGYGLHDFYLWQRGTVRQLPHGVDRRHGVRTADSFLRRICGEEAVVNSAHHQAVDRLGQGLEAVQWAPDGVVEAAEHRTLPVWGVQWHPERLPGELGRRLFEAFLERCRLGQG